eukprot:753067-Hanusia_phi.AAC.2
MQAGGRGSDSAIAPNSDDGKQEVECLWWTSFQGATGPSVLLASLCVPDLDYNMTLSSSSPVCSHLRYFLLLSDARQLLDPIVTLPDAGKQLKPSAPASATR